MSRSSRLKLATYPDSIPCLTRDSARYFCLLCSDSSKAFFVTMKWNALCFMDKSILSSSAFVTRVRYLSAAFCTSFSRFCISCSLCSVCCLRYRLCSSFSFASCNCLSLSHKLPILSLSFTISSLL